MNRQYESQSHDHDEPPSSPYQREMSREDQLEAARKRMAREAEEVRQLHYS